MSAAAVLREALLAALRDDPALALNGVWEGTPVKATPPYAVLRDLVAVDWGAKDRAGRELRAGVTIRTADETPLRAQTLAGAVERTIGGVPRDLAGWRIASAVLVRSAVLTEGAGRWAVLVDYRIRMLANEGEG